MAILIQVGNHIVCTCRQRFASILDSNLRNSGLALFVSQNGFPNGYICFGQCLGRNGKGQFLLGSVIVADTGYGNLGFACIGIILIDNGIILVLFHTCDLNSRLDFFACVDFVVQLCGCDINRGIGFDFKGLSDLTAVTALTCDDGIVVASIHRCALNGCCRTVFVDLFIGNGVVAGSAKFRVAVFYGNCRLLGFTVVGQIRSQRYTGFA